GYILDGLVRGLAKSGEPCQTSGLCLFVRGCHMGSAPAAGSLSRLTDAELIDLLPVEAIYKKSRGKPVQINRTAEERAVIAELWRRYQIHRIRIETDERISFLCPTQLMTVEV